MSDRTDAADSLSAVSDELAGIAEILFIMYERDFLQGLPADHLLVLSKLIERYSSKISGVAKEL